MVKLCVGVDLSKEFDTIDRYKILQVLKKEVWAGERRSNSLFLLRGTTPQVKLGKQKRKNLRNTRGVPPGNALSPRLCTLYLDEALRVFDFLRITKEPRQLSLNGHDYAVKNHQPYLHV